MTGSFLQTGQEESHDKVTFEHFFEASQTQTDAISLLYTSSDHPDPHGTQQAEPVFSF
jgi:hypothetical protein